MVGPRNRRFVSWPPLAGAFALLQRARVVHRHLTSKMSVNPTRPPPKVGGSLPGLEWWPYEEIMWTDSQEPGF